MSMKIEIDFSNEEAIINSAVSILNAREEIHEALSWIDDSAEAAPLERLSRSLHKLYCGLAEEFGGHDYFNHSIDSEDGEYHISKIA